MEKRNRILLLLRILLIASGVLWLSLAITGEGSPLLVASGIINIVTLLATLTSRRSAWLWSLVMATSSSNLIIYVYQGYAAYQLLQITLSQLPIASFLIDLVGAVFFIVLILRLYARPEELSSLPTPKTSEERKKSKD